MVPLQKRSVIIVLSLLVFIILSVILIFFLDKSSNNTPNLKLYESIKIEVQELSADPEINHNGNYQKMVSQLAKLENQSLSPAERTKIAESTILYLHDAYYSTHNHKLYSFAQNYKVFLAENFGNSVKYVPPCYDPQCADAPQPKEILSVIEKIKQSNIPEGLKDSVILDLTNFGYLKKGYGLPRYNIKIGSYISLAEALKKNPDFINAGINEEIYNDITNYVKVAFPDEYELFIKG